MTRIRPATLDDAAAIAAIYAPFVRDTAITFEDEVPTVKDICERMTFADGLYPWFVAEDATETVIGYAYATRFRARSAYRFAVETTVYVTPSTQRQGVGKALYEVLLAALTDQGFTQALALIALPNVGSIRLHEEFGFERTGVYRQTGYKLGEWHDVGIWQRALAESRLPPPEPTKFQPGRR